MTLPPGFFDACGEVAFQSVATSLDDICATVRIDRERCTVEAFHGGLVVVIDGGTLYECCWLGVMVCAKHPGVSISGGHVATQASVEMAPTEEQTVEGLRR